MLCLCGPEILSPAASVHGKTKLDAGGLAGAVFLVGQIGLASLVACPRSMSEMVA